MGILSNSVLFLIIAMIYVFFIARNFYKNNKQWSLKAKIWSIIVFVFLLISLLIG